MLVKQAKAAARAWVREAAGRTAGFAGAFFSGSINAMADEDPLPSTSDVDLLIVVDGPGLPPKPGKFRWQGALIEASYLPAADVRTPEQVLGTPFLAWSLYHDSLILDPTGRLEELQSAVKIGYAQRKWVTRRCAYARDRVLRNLGSVDAAKPLPDPVLAWLFAAGVTTHILLLAGLSNPTVRKRYLAVRELLAEYDRAAFYPTLLEMLGCEQMTQAQTAHHLDALAGAYDSASAVLHSPVEFAADIHPDARPVAIDGSRALITQGDHREAVFWIAVTYARCMKVLSADGPEAVHAQHLPGFTRLLADLGVAEAGGLRRRAEMVKALLPRVWQEAEGIMDANAEIGGM
jgi:hypothetical protein